MASGSLEQPVRVKDPVSERKRKKGRMEEEEGARLEGEGTERIWCRSLYPASPANFLRVLGKHTEPTVPSSFSKWRGRENDSYNNGPDRHNSKGHI